MTEGLTVRNVIETYARRLAEAYPDVAADIIVERDEILARLGAPVAREALEDMVRQFAYWNDTAGGYTTGGLSTLEYAFEVLGWDDPHLAPEVRCDEPGCMKQASCGWPTRPGGTGLNGGYRRTCGDHWRRQTSV